MSTAFKIGKEDQELQRQVKAIRLTMISRYTEVCNCCNMEYMPMLRINGDAPCPECDREFIDNVKYAYGYKFNGRG